jgi:hypothetical protein
MDPFNALSTTVATRKIPLLKEAPPAKVMSCALVTSTDLEMDLDDTKEVTRGADTPSVKMAGRSAMVWGHSVPRDEGRPTPAHQSCPCTRGHGTHLARAPSPRPMIAKEHRSVTPIHPTSGILKLRKATIQYQLVVPSNRSDDNLSLVKHDARVDLTPAARGSSTPRSLPSCQTRLRRVCHSTLC